MKWSIFVFDPHKIVTDRQLRKVTYLTNFFVLTKIKKVMVLFRNIVHVSFVSHINDDQKLTMKWSIFVFDPHKIVTDRQLRKVTYLTNFFVLTKIKKVMVLFRNIVHVSFVSHINDDQKFTIKWSIFVFDPHIIQPLLF